MSGLSLFLFPTCSQTIFHRFFYILCFVKFEYIYLPFAALEFMYFKTLKLKYKFLGCTAEKTMDLLFISQQFYILSHPYEIFFSKIFVPSPVRRQPCSLRCIPCGCRIRRPWEGCNSAETFFTSDPPPRCLPRRGDASCPGLGELRIPRASGGSASCLA